MEIVYTCRHCGTQVGCVKVTEAFSMEKLGLSSLSAEDRLEMIHYEPDGSMHISGICEDCQEVLQRYPDYHQWTTFIQ